MMVSLPLHLSVLLALAGAPKRIELDVVVIKTEVKKPSTFVILPMPSSLKPPGIASGLERFRAMFRASAGLGSVADLLVTAWHFEETAVAENLSRMASCETTGAKNCGDIDLRKALVLAERARAKLRRGDPLEASVQALLWRIHRDEGPAFDRARAEAALEALIRLELPRDIGAWAHFTLGSEARDEERFEDAHRHLLAGQAFDATTPGGPRWFFDYLIAFTEWALGNKPPTVRMETAIDKARTENPEVVPSLEFDLLAFFAFEPEKVGYQLEYLETHCGTRAPSLLSQLADFYDEVGEVKAAGIVRASLQ
jgi:hypothetical protein